MVYSDTKSIRQASSSDQTSFKTGILLINGLNKKIKKSLDIMV